MAAPFLGHVSLFPYDFAPSGWKTSDGSSLSTSDYYELYEIVRNTFGGDDQKFYLPDLRSMAPYECRFCIKATGDLPISSYHGVTGETFFLTSLSPIPPNMLECAGQPLAKGKHQYLEQYMGTRFGGGPNSYNMPDLRSKSPVGLNYVLTVDGSPPDSGSLRDTFIGELFLLPFELTRTTSMTLCDGKEMYAPQMPALYAVLGNRFGGSNPRFALPDLRGSAPSNFNYYLSLNGSPPSKD